MWQTPHAVSGVRGGIAPGYASAARARHRARGAREGAMRVCGTCAANLRNQARDRNNKKPMQSVMLSRLSRLVLPTSNFAASTRHMASVHTPITRIIRFEDESGGIMYGEEPPEGVTEVTVLDGDIYTGLTRSNTVAKAHQPGRREKCDVGYAGVQAADASDSVQHTLRWTQLHAALGRGSKKEGMYARASTMCPAC